MASAMVLSGGVAHDFPATSQAVRALLAEVGVAATVRTDPVVALGELAGVDLVVVNMLRWRMEVERYAALRERWGLSLPPAARAALLAHVEGGGGLLGLHAASICFDDWPQWRGLLGGAWNWARSGHPPVGPARVEVVGGRHPLVAGLSDFDIDDEVYGFQDLEPDVVPLLTGSHGGTAHPMLWARTVGAGRVVYDALGHHLPSYEVAAHRIVVRRAALWALGRPDEEVSTA